MPSASNIRELSGSSYHRGDRDEKLKTSYPTSPSSSKPGAHPTNESPRSRKEDKKRTSRSGTSSSNRDLDAKSKAKRSSEDGPSTPGAHHATKDRFRKVGKGRPSGSGNSSNRDPEGRPSLSGTSPTRDRDAKAKVKRSSSDVPSSPGVARVSGNTQEDRAARKTRRNESRNAASTVNAVEDVLPDAYQIQVELATEDPPIENQAADDPGASPQESGDKQPPSRKRNRKRLAIGIAVSLLLVGGAIAAMNLLPLKPKTVVPESVSESQNKTADTSVPPTALSSSPSSLPTINYQHDPPSPDFCIAVAQNLTMREERVGMDQHNFGLTIDVTLDVTDGLADSQVFTLASAIQQKLVPPLLGCDYNGSRRNLNKEEAAMIRGSAQIRRQLDLGANRYIIADAFVNGKKIQDACTKTLFQSQCHRVFVELAVFLKGPIRLLDIIFLIHEKVGKQLQEEGAHDGNLKKGLGLEYPFRNVQLVQIDNLSLTTAPSSMPTNLPSISTSSSAAPEQTTPPPATLPAVGSSPPPTTKLIETSANPSHPPSKSPSIPPALSPVSGPTSPPSVPPTKAPSQIPSARPSLLPSGTPSLAPVVGPSPPPTTAPSLNPTAKVSEAPSRNSSSKPSSNPSQRPSARLSMDPSSRPSMMSPSEQPPTPPPTTASPTAPCICPRHGTCNNSRYLFSIGCGSCQSGFSCYDMSQSSEGSATFTIGTNSCTATNSCNSATIHTIGNGSCTGVLACSMRHINVSSNSCTGYKSCRVGGASDPALPPSLGGFLTVGDGSCTGSNSCVSSSGTVGNGSCTGENSCGGRSVLTIGHGSCTGTNSCTGFILATNKHGDRVPSTLRPITVSGNNSCTCESCCRCMTYVGIDNSCNSLDVCCSLADPRQKSSFFIDTTDLY